jgi:hypothetical protein
MGILQLGLQPIPLPQYCDHRKRLQTKCTATGQNDGMVFFYGVQGTADRSRGFSEPRTSTPATAPPSVRIIVQPSGFREVTDFDPFDIGEAAGIRGVQPAFE